MGSGFACEEQCQNQREGLINPRTKSRVSSTYLHDVYHRYPPVLERERGKRKRIKPTARAAATATESIFLYAPVRPPLLLRSLRKAASKKENDLITTATRPVSEPTRTADVSARPKLNQINNFTFQNCPTGHPGSYRLIMPNKKHKFIRK